MQHMNLTSEVFFIGLTKKICHFTMKKARKLLKRKLIDSKSNFRNIFPEIVYILYIYI